MISRGGPSKLLGFFGLIWFVYFVGSATLSLVAPDRLRAHSEHPWTDREIHIGAACYVAIGSGGGIIAFRRLLWPPLARLLAPPPRVGADVAPLLLWLDVIPTYEHAYVLRARLWRRFTRRLWAYSIAFLLASPFITASVAVFLLDRRPRPSDHQIAGGAIIAIGLLMIVTAPLFERWTRRHYSWARWQATPRFSEPRRYEFYDDGILVRGPSFARAVGWRDVRGIEVFSHAVFALSVPGEWFVFATTDMTPEAGWRLLDLLARKLKIPAPPCPPSPTVPTSLLPPTPPPPAPTCSLSTAP